jgi:hypothetical protein
MLAMILAHAGGEDGTLMLLALAPVGLILLVGFVIVLRPVVNAIGQPQPVEREKDLADHVLGEEEAQRLRVQGRRRRSIRRRLLRAHLTRRSTSD